MRGQYKNARDGNEKVLFKILRDYGIQVYPTDQPLDSICAFKGVNYLVEIKNGPKAKLTKGQKDFTSDWRGQYVVLCSEDEAHAWARSIVSVKRTT